MYEMKEELSFSADYETFGGAQRMSFGARFYLVKGTYDGRYDNALFQSRLDHARALV